MLKSSGNVGANERLVTVAGGVAGAGGAIAMNGLMLATAVWSLFGMATRRISFDLARSDWFLVAATLSFVLVQMIFAAINAPSFQGTLADVAWQMAPLGLYLMPVLVIPRLRQPRFDALNSLILGSGFCAIFPLPLALYQVVVHQDRATGVTGNALPFALISAVFCILALFNALSSYRPRILLGLVGYASGIACLLLSGSIGLLPVVIPATIAFAILYHRTLAHLYSRRNLAIGSVLAVLIGLAAAPWTERLVNMALFIIRPDASKKFTTFNLRIDMWNAALDLIRARPLLGYGLQNREALLHQTTGLEFVQFHNGILNAAVEAGVLGVLATLALLFAPLVTALSAPKDIFYGRRLFIAAFLTAIFLVGGMSYVMFLDVVYDSVFLWVAVCIAVSVPMTRENPSLFKPVSG